MSASSWLARIVERINKTPPTEADLNEYHSALRADYVERGNADDHPVNGYGWCITHGSSCPFSAMDGESPRDFMLRTKRITPDNPSVPETPETLSVGPKKENHDAEV